MISMNKVNVDKFKTKTHVLDCHCMQVIPFSKSELKLYIYNEVNYTRDNILTMSDTLFNL